jgi:predicted nuclease of predicted toxin-antitoxin system
MLHVELAELLRREGHDVVRASDTGQNRADDDEILEQAVQDARVLVTLDGHFGDWAVLPLHRHPGVIRLRVHPTTAQIAAAVLLPLLRGRSQEDFRDCLVIVSRLGSRWIRTA